VPSVAMARPGSGNGGTTMPVDTYPAGDGGGAGRGIVPGDRLLRRTASLARGAAGPALGQAPRVRPQGDAGARLAEPAAGWRVGDWVIVTSTGRSRITDRSTLRLGGPWSPRLWTSNGLIRPQASFRSRTSTSCRKACTSASWSYHSS